MDSVTARAASDQTTLGRRLYIGDIHEGVLPAELDAAISGMGYEIETPTQLITTRHGSTVAYITLTTNDDAVDLILRSDSLIVGDPVCRLRIKVARPRPAPRLHHPTAETVAQGDQKDSEAHGDSHGMTDIQITRVSDTLQTIQESTLNTIVNRLSGAISGLPSGFQLAIDNRLTRIESTIAHGQHQQAQDMAEHRASLAASNQMQETRLQSMEQTIRDLTAQIGKLTQAQEEWSDSWEFEPNPTIIQGGDSPTPTFAQQPGDSNQPPTPELQPETALVSTPPTGCHNGADVTAPSPLAFFAPLLELSTPAIPVFRKPDNPVSETAVSEELSKRKAPSDSPQQILGTRRGRLGKINKDEAAGANADSEGHATDQVVPPDTLALEDSSHQTSQTREDPLEYMLTEELMATPFMELAPGFTAFTCDALITAFNSVHGRFQTLETGDTAAQLLRNAQEAEQLLYKISHASELQVAQGWDPAKATAALEAVDAAKASNQAQTLTYADHNQQKADTSL
jgi:hypothetical protein